MRWIIALLLISCGPATFAQSLNSVFKIERYRNGVLEGNATGVAVKTINGSTYILTNRHVCHDRDASSFVLIDSSLGHHPAVYHSVHSFADLCLLKADKVFPIVEFNSPIYNEKVTSIGAPHGMFPIYNTGIVKTPVVINSTISGENYFFTGQVVIIESEEGNSGSPVFNSRQKVVGIIFGTANGRDSFMVPSFVILPFLENVR